MSLVLVSSVLQTQHIEDGCPAPLTVHLQTLSLFFAPPTATDGKVDDSSLENLDVWIIEIQTSQTDPRRLLITDCGAQFISLGPRTVGVTAGLLDRYPPAGCGSNGIIIIVIIAALQQEVNGVSLQRSLSGQSQSWLSFGRCVH